MLVNYMFMLVSHYLLYRFIQLIYTIQKTNPPYKREVFRSQVLGEENIYPP